MLGKVNSVEELDNENTVRFLLDMFHRIIIHYGLWFNEIKNHMGMEKALEMLKIASERSYGIQLKRL